MKGKKNKKKIRVYVGGTMDLFHYGHVNLLKKASQIGDIVIVALNRDEFNERYKGRKPILSLKERISLVKSCRYVDKVVINEGDEDSTLTIIKHKPNIILHGDDWLKGAFVKQMGLTREFLKKHKIKLKFVSYTKGVSTTEVKRRIIRQHEINISQKQ